MKNYLMKLDAFGTTFHFTTMNECKFRTPIGAALSIICILLIIIFGFLFGRDFLYKKNPKILTQIMVPDKYNDPFRMSADNFVIPWRITDLNGVPIEFENIFYPVITYYRYETNSSGLMMTYNRRVNFLKCNETLAKVPQFTEIFSVENYYCMDWSEDNYTFGGNWDGQYFHSFDITFHFCKDGQKFSPESKCTDINIIKHLINQYTYFELLYPEYYFIPDDLDSPLKIYYKMYDYMLSLNTQKLDRLYFKDVYLFDDQGWIITDYNQTKNKGAAYIKSDFYNFEANQFGIDGNDSFFYSIEFATQRNYDKIYRSYMKFQDLAAIIGGFMKTILFVGGLFSYFCNDIIRDEIIYNLLFEYKPINEDTNEKVDKLIRMNSSMQSVKINQNKLVKTKCRERNDQTNNYNLKDSQIFNSLSNNVLLNKHFSKIEKTNPISILNKNKLILKNIFLDNSQNMDYLNKLKTMEKKKTTYNSEKSLFKLNKETNKKSIKFGLWFSLKGNYFRFKCVRNSKEKEKMYYFLYSYLKQRLDVTHYLKKINILDRMKTLLFNYHQSLSLEYLKTPNLCNDSEMKIYYSEYSINEDKNLNDLVEYYSNRIKNKEMSDVDNYLLNSIYPEIRKLAI